jgi:peptide/nickel transport system ATP-binding protein
VSTLSVRNLTVTLGKAVVVDGVSFDLDPGQRLGIIGESGSGKTVTALAVMGLLAPALRATGQVLIGDRDLLAMTERQRCEVRGGTMAMVFQEPMTALNPTMRVGRQIAEAIRVHQRCTRAEARQRAIGLLARVEFTDPPRQARAYPHQLSGGQRQRVMLAMAIACDPAVILADEPTTALDVTVQAQMLALMARLVTEENAALLLISHDLAVVSGMCERVMVMYGGHVVESGSTAQVLAAPRHPYTAGLIATSVAVALDSDRTRLEVPYIPGQVPAVGSFPVGCPFRSRCDRATAECAVMPPIGAVGDHLAACHHPLGAGSASRQIPASLAESGKE